MNKLWHKLSPKNRRLAVIGAAVGVFSLAVAMLPEGEKRERTGREEPALHAILTDRDNGNVRFERLMAQLENMRDDNQRLTKEIERMRRDMERLEAGEIGPSLSRELQRMQQRIEEMQANAELGLPVTGATNKDGHVVIGEGKKGDDKDSGKSTAANDVPVIKEPTAPTQAQMWDVPPEPAAPQTGNERGAKGGQTKGEAAQTSTIRVIEGAKPQPTEAELEAQKAESEGIYIPAGSIITGTLVTGLDAPTGKQARQEPHPALLRIKHEAILPNRFRADVRECFALLGGFGELSSERAYLRGETISCVRKDGKVVESSLESFTVGEDGKAGVRGRLVSKQGQMLSKALTAGVIEGFAGAFDRVPVPTLSLDSSGKQLYQQAFSGDAMQSGAVAGIGKALDRLAQFYIDQAEGMFPVIEIDAGREVEIVLIRGGKLALK